MHLDNLVIPIPLGFVKSFIIRGEKSILVDTGIRGSSEKIFRALAQNNIKPADISLILITHAHSDHYGSLLALKSVIGAPVAIHRSEADYLRTGSSAPVVIHSPLLRVASKLLSRGNLNSVKPDILIDDQFDLNEYGVDGVVLHTPGHTGGSISVVLSNGEAVVGDTIGGKSDGTKAAVPPIYTDLSALLGSVGKVIAAGGRKIYTAHGGVYTPSVVSALSAKGKSEL